MLDGLTVSLLAPRGVQMKTLLGLTAAPSSVSQSQRPRSKQPKPRAEPPPKKRRKWKEEFAASGSSGEEGGEEDGKIIFFFLAIFCKANFSHLVKVPAHSALWVYVICYARS